MTKLQKQHSSKFRTAYQGRLTLVCVCFLLCGAALLAKLFYLQIFQHEDLLAQSDKQYMRTVKIFYGRGKILDRNMNELATNIEVESVYVNPAEVQDKKYTARTLAAILDLDQEQVLKKIFTKKHFIWIKRKCILDETEKLRQINLPGVGFVAEHKRFYPKRELAANAIGFVGLDNQGLAGAEHFHDNLLKGQTSLRMIEKDARGRNIRSVGYANEQNDQSSDVVLTLDEVIQFIAEYHLSKQTQKYQAKAGIAVVMNPNTGEIYAMAGSPQYNPNNYSAYAPNVWKNLAVANAYEPGSIFKPVVAAAAIEANVTSPGEMFFCENGSYKVGHTRVGEAADHKFGWLSLENIIAKSSNIGAIKIAEKLGKNNLYEQVRSFGFGDKLGVDLPGETPGQLRELSHWSNLSLSSISFGHEIAVTPIQMLAAISAIANGGKLMLPHITKAVVKNGHIVRATKPAMIKQVLSEKTSRQMVEIMKTVVTTGTGLKAAVEGFEVAGKTGTAQKINPETQTYSKTGFIASFVGFVPADAPKLAILVMIDEPKDVFWGGEVAAPVFRDIAQQVLRYLNTPSKDERVFILDRA